MTWLQCLQKDFRSEIQVGFVDSRGVMEDNYDCETMDVELDKATIVASAPCRLTYLYQFLAYSGDATVCLLALPWT